MRDGSNPDYYANTNWWKSAVKSNDGMHQANVRVSGGTAKSAYMISGGYASQTKGWLRLPIFPNIMPEPM